MKPLDYGMSSTLINEIAEQNLRLIASILIYVVRKVSVPVNTPMMVGTRYIVNNANLYSGNSNTQII